MTPATRRRLAPLGASVAVLAVFLGPGVLASTATSGTGPPPDRTVTPDDPVTPVLPPDGADEPRTGGRDVEMIGYRPHGSALEIFYTVDQRQGCSADIDRPKVEERVGSVRVTLTRTPSRDAGEICSQRLGTSAVLVPLERPMGGRVLQDGSRGGTLVPVARPFGSDVVPTQPASRSGR